MRFIFFGLLMCLIFAHTSSAQPLSVQELAQVKQAIGNSRIIGLGEEEHFFKASNINRIELIKSLINHGYINSLVFEYPATSSAVINSYINNRIQKTALLDQLKKMSRLNAGAFFDSEEMLAFVEWLKKHNTQKSDKIEVHGMDFYNYIAAIALLQQKIPPQKFAKIRQTLDTLTYYLHHKTAALANKETRLLAAQNLGEVKTLLSTTDIANTNPMQLAASELYNYSYWFTDNNNRDSLMFQNFVKIDRPNKKHLIWAANFHIQNDSLHTTHFKVNLFGNFMNKKYGSQYHKIGVISYPSCGLDTNKKRIQIPDTLCSYYHKLDVLIMMQKGNRTSSIFEK